MGKLTEYELTHLIIENSRPHNHTSKHDSAQGRAWLRIWWNLPTAKHIRGEGVIIPEIEKSIAEIKAYKSRFQLTLTEKRIFEAWIKKVETAIENWRN